MSDLRTLRVALLGAGSVGSQVARILIEDRAELAARAGITLDLVGVAVRSLDSARDWDIPAELLTTDATALVQRADVVIELIGGIEPARTLILEAVAAGADVVTGNKALIAAHGPELFDAAARVGALISYEAAVAGAIPILRPLRESLAGDKINRILAIVNGSTNFILDRMDRFGDTMEQAQKTAFELGFLEADPTLDVDGYDAAQKAAILARLAFHADVPAEAVYREGIADITAEQIRDAAAAGATIKLLAIAERVTGEHGEGISTRVYPALIPKEHPLASVHGGNNAVFVEAAAAGPLMFYGAGAGGVQTASAVLGDLVSAARRHVAGGPGLTEGATAKLPLIPIGEVSARYQIALRVSDRPGVLAQIAGILAEAGVSVETVVQSAAEADEVSGEHAAMLVIGTHTSREDAVQNTVNALRSHEAVRAVISVLRFEGE
ncbi:homoserine dehydrogenase [Mycetocola tolaasinivorans]|uniref:Homoserine dehydrogenase n=1 Tax=Mycetocola tolaasinivorans TaxID=76635 RepID=A0A3L7A1U2_9MICO|nr:homoserine dehydrogenase [Mycetocola tolaasinivorans]RLP73342.1 homoserine dehydrogenase [Mycetocola tolaasinivorans]